MKKSDLFSMALENLKNRKTRTKLTVIGVVIGTCAIVIMVSIGVGIDKMVTNQYKTDSSLSKINVYVAYDDKNEDDVVFDERAVDFMSSISNVEAVVPKLSITDYATVTRGKYSTQWCPVYGIDFEQMEKIGYRLEEGSFQNIDKNSAFFGKRTVTNFADKQGNSVKYKFDENYEVSECEIDPMNDVFFITPLVNDDGDNCADTSSLSQKLNVSGILKTDYKIDYDTDCAVYVNMDLAKDMLEKYNRINPNNKASTDYSEILVFVNDMENVEQVTKKLQEAGFSCYSDMEELEYTKKIMMVVQLVLGAIGAVSMFVAAFGISNTMVMSVFERTKEIGIMKVLGCSLSDIRSMFLYEAGIIGFLGGTIGVIISYIISIIANIIARAVVSSMGGEEELSVCVSSIPVWLALLGIAFAVFVGIISGLKPANRSVKISALTAIHNE